jgi:hypothetical protein
MKPTRTNIKRQTEVKEGKERKKKRWEEKGNRQKVKVEKKVMPKKSRFYHVKLVSTLSYLRLSMACVFVTIE